MPKRDAHHSGFTLVELLIAISIITVLAAIALPTLKNSLREQRLSRSAGLIQQYIEEARARAIGSGRPAGVVLERFGAEDAVNRSQVTRLRICTSPPQYVGDFGGATSLVNRVYTTSPPPPQKPETFVEFYFDEKVNLLLDSAANGYNNSIQIGDYILLGQEQVPRRIVSMVPYDPGNPPMTPPTPLQVTVRLVEPGMPNLIVRSGLQLPFTIVRQPTISYAAPLELVDNTVIDLLYSGVGPFGTTFSPLTMESSFDATTSYDPSASTAFSTAARDYMQVWIVFNPDGSLARIYMGQPNSTDVIVPFSFAPLSDVHLLVGRTGQVRPDLLLSEENGEIPNLLDDQAIWITINRMSGSTSSAANDVAAVAPITGAASQAQVENAVLSARSYALGSRD